MLLATGLQKVKCLFLPAQRGLSQHSSRGEGEMARIGQWSELMSRSV